MSQGKQQVRERNQPLSLAELERVEAGEVGVTALVNPLSEELSVQFGELCILGKTVNTRRVFPLIDGYIAEVDCTEFPSGRVDYEVEVELRQSTHTFASAARALSTALGSEIFAALEPSTSKYRRFLDTLS
ncbi:MAG TPA: hypothetical protein EYN66_23555 [Myxococcales bacterium]|nr:hypothetical protein [Myxococcales bacterium]